MTATPAIPPQNLVSDSVRANIVDTLARYCPEVRALDLCGARRRDVARLLSEIVGEEVTTAQLYHWDCGIPVPVKWLKPLHKIAWHAHHIGMETLLALARDKPHLIRTIGFRRFSQRLTEARNILLLSDAPKA